MSSDVLRRLRSAKNRAVRGERLDALDLNAMSDVIAEIESLRAEVERLRQEQSE